VIELCEVTSHLTDEFDDESEVVGISTGDVYEDGGPLATYLAAWYPESLRELVVLLTMGRVDSGAVWRPSFHVAARCAVGDPARLRVVTPEEQPWDSLHSVDCLRPEEVPAHPLAARAFEIFRAIVRDDPAIARYLTATEPIPFDPADIPHPDEDWKKPAIQDPEPSAITPPATLAFDELVRGFDRVMQPWRALACAAPTPASLARIERELGIELPGSLVELARRSACFGAWFASLGDDEGDIVRLNRIWHREVEPHERMPAHLILINHGHDDDCDCFDLSRPRTAAGEYAIRYWSWGHATWTLSPDLPSYLEDFIRSRERQR
jgi:hypothetical protein